MSHLFDRSSPNSRNQVLDDSLFSPASPKSVFTKGSPFPATCKEGTFIGSFTGQNVHKWTGEDDVAFVHMPQDKWTHPGKLIEARQAKSVLSKNNQDKPEHTEAEKEAQDLTASMLDDFPGKHLSPE